MKKGWQKQRLGEVTTKIGSGATPRGGDESYKAEGISLIRSLNVHDDGFRETKLARIDDEQADDLSNVIVEPHDVLLNITGASVARCCRAPADFLPARVNQHVSIIRPVQAKLDSDFLHYLLISKIYKDRLLHTGEEGGSTRQAITKAQLQEFVIEFPESLAEQQRIVGLLDEAFEGLATAKANAEKNFQNALALFESHLQSVFTQRGKGWLEKKLGEVSEFKNGLNYNKSSVGQTLPVVGVADFQDNYFVPLSELQSATIDGDLAENYAIQQNDILTVRSNGSKHLVGRCMLVGDVDEVVSYSGFIIRIRFDAKVIFPQFLLHFMKCQVTRDILTAGGGGANINNINQEKLSSLLVPLPPYKTQVKLAALLDDIREETRRLESIYQRKLAAIDELKKSLLNQAFSGEL
jgi:type I restriction enzyme S subunit